MANALTGNYVNHSFAISEYFIVSVGRWSGMLIPSDEVARPILDNLRGLIHPAFIRDSSTVDGIDHFIFAGNSLNEFAKNELIPEVPGFDAFYNAYTVAFGGSAGGNPPRTTDSNHSIFEYTWPRPPYLHARAGFSGMNSPLFSFLELRQYARVNPIRLLSTILHSATGRHVASGGSIMHSSGISIETRGFLFLGDSGAGKSTVARISSDCGYDVLGDDLNFIVSTGRDTFSISAAPSAKRQSMAYSPKSPQLEAVFVLHKDVSDDLVPLSQRDTAAALMQGFYQTPFGRKLPPHGVEQSFHSLSHLARHIPGYELHFRKDPSFLNIIKKEFEID